MSGPGTRSPQYLAIDTGLPSIAAARRVVAGSAQQDLTSRHPSKSRLQIQLESMLPILSLIRALHLVYSGVSLKVFCKSPGQRSSQQHTWSNAGISMTFVSDWRSATDRVSAGGTFESRPPTI